MLTPEKRGLPCSLNLGNKIRQGTPGATSPRTKFGHCILDPEVA